jgi:glycosyltransferase involved in cell wall biosynthesis
MGDRLRLAHLATVDMSLSLLLATELAAGVKAGLDVYGISAPGPYVKDVTALGVRHVAIPSLTRRWDPWADVAAARQLYEVLRGLDLHVLHTHNPKTGVLGRLLGRAARVPIVVNTCHGLWMSETDRLLKRAAVRAVEVFAGQFSHAELYQNEEDRRALRLFVPFSKAQVVGNGIDLSRFRCDPDGRQQVRKELGIGDEEILVGGVGRRVAEKGVVEFAVTARALGDEARFVWIGPEDPDKPDAVHRVEDGVQFLGFRNDMPAVYSALDVFVLPSHREGFSRSAMEAAACGCALVATDIRGCREIGEHNKHLLLVPPREPAVLTAAVTQLLRDPALRQRLASAAKARARNSFDQSAVAAASLATYRSVARRNGLDWWQQIPGAEEC